ncbi:hypothetical protein [Gemmatimonas sp.]|uniref:hypothetical protein n=1 Tax=Gemmatimonas sp. TaxID=1962908 RepID=UPI00286B89D4|nr:hypothetical protein [Gemmatimonas sp.]
MRFPTSVRAFLMISATSAAVACSDDATAPDPSGPVTIAIAQSLTGQTTSAGAFTMSGSRADSGSTTEVLTFGGPLTQSPVPLTYVRTLTGKQGTLTVRGSATLTFSSQTAATLAGTWTVEKGTGTYANTTGTGTITGSANFGATPPTGTLTYTGRLDR